MSTGGDGTPSDNIAVREILSVELGKFSGSNSVCTLF